MNVDHLKLYLPFNRTEKRLFSVKTVNKDHSVVLEKVVNISETQRVRETTVLVHFVVLLKMKNAISDKIGIFRLLR